jgi:hypothetical protein
MAFVSRYVNYGAKYYCFTNTVATFGSDIAFVMPIHGDFNCPCNTCRLAKGIKEVERTHKVRLEKILDYRPLNIASSEEFEKTMYYSMGIFRIALSSIFKD